MANSIKVELNQTKLRLAYYQARHDQTPNEMDAKWIAIFNDRVTKLERLLLVDQARRARASSVRP